MALTHNTAYVDTALRRLPGQYQGKPRMEAVVRAFALEAQALEDAIWSLIVGRELQNRQSPINVRAVFDGSTGTVAVQWPIAFADTTYEVVAGNAVNTGAPALIGANLDGTTKTTKGITVIATAAFTGWVDIIAYEAGANPLVPILRGDILDKLGKIVGQPRNGMDDSSYLILITARIAANRSDGRRESLIRLARLLVPGAAVYVKDFPPCAVYIAPQAKIPVDPYIAAQFMEAAKAAGVELVFAWTPVDLANTIIGGSIYSSGFSAGPAPTNTGATSSQSPGSIYHASFAAGPVIANDGGGMLSGVVQSQGES